MEDEVALFFIFIMDGIRRWKYLIIATLVTLGILYWIVSMNNQAEQACRDKGGVPISTDNGVKCTSGLIK